MFCSLLEGKSITAHKNWYIAAGFKPPLVLVRSTHILLYQKTHNMLRKCCMEFTCLFHLLRTRNRLRIVGIFLSSLKKAPEKRLCRHLLIHRQNLLAPYQFNRFCDYFRTKVAKATHRQFTISGQH